MKLGDFTNLAQSYSKFRPKYSDSVRDTIIALLPKKFDVSNVADLGAGTGIWTRMLYEKTPNYIVAIEPNDSMLKVGKNDSKGTKIKWIKGTGEKTGLEDKDYDLVTMASSFHWVDFKKGCEEFHRILKEDGIFVALWNPRIIEDNSVLGEIENFILKLQPDLKRNSSGNSQFTKNLEEKLYDTGLFDNIVCLSSMHKIKISPKHYLGAWKSTNEVQSKLGKKKFTEFIEFAQSKLVQVSSIEQKYLTKAWVCRKK